MAMIQSLNDKQLTTFTDLAEVVQKRILNSFWTCTWGWVVCPLSLITTITHCRSKQQKESYEVSTRICKVPNYRKFLKKVGHKASLANYISQYILDHVANYIPHGKFIVLGGGFTEKKLLLKLLVNLVCEH